MHRRQQERHNTDLVGDEVLNAVEEEVDSLEDTTERQQRMELLQRAVALRLGYTSQAAFSRVYKRINGQPTSATRQVRSVFS